MYATTVYAKYVSIRVVDAHVFLYSTSSDFIFESRRALSFYASTDCFEVFLFTSSMNVLYFIKFLLLLASVRYLLQRNPTYRRVSQS